MVKKGWIKLHRQSVDNPMYFTEPFDKWHAWTDLLLMVNHERKQFISKGQLVTLEPGQTVTSIAILAERWQWSENKVRRYMRLLNGSGMCTSNGTPNGTLITVVNWAKYQAEGQSNGMGDGRTDGSTDGRADGRLTRIIKNNKEYKKAPESVLDKQGVQREIDLDALILEQIINNGKTDINEAK